MENIRSHKNAAIIAICLVVILITGIITATVKSANGTVAVKEVVISPYGADLAMTMYMPNEALKTAEGGNFLNQGKYPAVIINSGYTEDRSCLDNIAIELAKRGFVVAQFDMYGHGRSDVISTRGYGNIPDPFNADMSLLGAYDVLDYLRTLKYVDQSRIGMIGHSLGGSAVGAMTATSAGHYTLQDTLMNLLHDEFGISISAAQVAAQDADSIAAANLDGSELQSYEQRKAEITEAYNNGLRSMVILDAGIGTAAPKVVEVAGNPVWRDAQANMAIFANISGGLSRGIQDPDFCRSSQDVLSLLSQENPVERNTWYTVELSENEDRVISTSAGDFYGDRSDAAIREFAGEHRLRLLVQPKGWHAFTYISGETATAAVQFFTTTMGFDSGDIVPGAASPALTSAETGSWKVKEVASGIAFFALIAMIIPALSLLMGTRLFSGLNGNAPEARNTKPTAIFVVFTLITTFVPMFLYPKGVGWAKDVGPSPISTIQIATQTAIWALVMAAMIFVLTLVKYYAFDKKALGVSYTELYGLKIKKENVIRSICLALTVFAGIALVLTLYYHLFGAAKMRITPLGKIEYVALVGRQYYDYFLYAICFFPFYMINAMMTNSARFKNMSEKKNMYVIAAVNCSGMLLLSILQIIFGLYMKGSALLPTVPGTSATIYNLPFFAFMLFVSAIINRKMYLKTGATLPGVFVNAAIFTFPSILSFACFSF